MKAKQQYAANSKNDDWKGNSIKQQPYFYVIIGNAKGIDQPSHKIDKYYTRNNTGKY